MRVGRGREAMDSRFWKFLMWRLVRDVGRRRWQSSWSCENETTFWYPPGAMMSSLRKRSQLSPHSDRGVFRFSQSIMSTSLKLGAKPKPRSGNDSRLGHPLIYRHSREVRFYKWWCLRPLHLWMESNVRLGMWSGSNSRFPQFEMTRCLRVEGNSQLGNEVRDCNCA